MSNIRRVINSFTGENYFLSNFSPSLLTVLGVPFNNVEAAFQACKTLDIEERYTFSNMTASESKKAGRRVKLRAGWNEILRVECMELCLRSKFADEKLKDKLKATGQIQLVEGNTWNDKYWGVCKGQGENMLGKLLMEIRGTI